MPKTTIYLELELEIEFDYQKPERMTRHYPGCPEVVELCALSYNSIEFDAKLFDAILRDHEESLEEACWDEIAEDRIAAAEAKFESMREEKMFGKYWGINK